jgi:membrane-bound lytic murein transglycosylase D
MRATGAVYGLQANRLVDDRRDPLLATKAAAHHLRDLYQRFGSWDLALAAYNMGYEQLLDAIDSYGTTEFNELARQRAIPNETANYVPKIIAAALVANNLERYGFGDVQVFRPLHSAELSVPGGTPLATIAKAAGISTARLQAHNPQLLRNALPPGSEQVVYVPAPALSRARAALPVLLDAGGRGTDADILAPDDLFGLGGDERARMSAWGEEENLLPMLPKPKRRSLRAVLSGSDGAAAEEPLADDFEGDRRSDREVVMYRVGPGETMIGLAKQFAVDVDDLARDNGLEPEDKLREGSLLRLMVKRQVLDRWKRAAGDAGTKARPRRPAPGAERDKSAEPSETG